LSWSLIISYIFLTILAVFAVFPFLWIVSTAIKSPGETTDNPISLFPKDITFENYIKAFSELGFGTNLLNSLLISIATTIIALIVSAMAAYAIVRFFPNSVNILSN